MADKSDQKHVQYDSVIINISPQPPLLFYNRSVMDGNGRKIRKYSIIVIFLMLVTVFIILLFLRFAGVL
jgi:hypothetical protein